MTTTAAAVPTRPTAAPSELDGIYRKIIWRWEDGGIETEDDWKAG